MKFRTLNSVYTVGDGKWTRESTNGVKSDAPLRTEEGVMWDRGPLVVGKPFVIICPPIDKTKHYREIKTSNVVEVLER